MRVDDKNNTTFSQRVSLEIKKKMWFSKYCMTEIQVPSFWYWISKNITLLDFYTVSKEQPYNVSAS